MKDVDIAWAAGLFEGEGCATTKTRHGSISYASLQLGMIDEGPVKKFAAVVGRGTVRCYLPPSHAVLGRRPTWLWRASADADVIHVGELLLPFLHERRTVAVQKAILVARTPRTRKAGVRAPFTDQARKNMSIAQRKRFAREKEQLA